jgi:predicted 3-demethylubiquinone-9 3-methyltransferase (glyoxalase superfamily)
MMQQKMTPCLWFEDQAEEAAEFYVSVFPDSKVIEVSHYGDEMPDQAGKVMTVSFQLGGQQFVALNGGPEFKFNEAISFQVSCESQEEVDEYWRKLTAGGGEESQCAWLKDKFGLSWQIIPTALPELLNDPDPVKSQRVMKAMLQMKKIDIAALQRAHAGK